MPKIELNLPEPPEGYEYTGEWRQLFNGELFADNYGHWRPTNLNWITGCYPVIAKKRWRARERCGYYHVHEVGEIRHAVEVSAAIDDARFAVGNYFQSKEEAEAMAEKFKQLFKEGLK